MRWLDIFSTCPSGLQQQLGQRRLKNCPTAMATLNLIITTPAIPPTPSTLKPATSVMSPLANIPAVAHPLMSNATLSYWLNGTHHSRAQLLTTAACPAPQGPCRSKKTAPNQLGQPPNQTPPKTKFWALLLKQ